MPLVCAKCMKKFATCTVLLKHIKIMHPFLERYDCKNDNCLRSFTNISSLKKHIIMKHVDLSKERDCCFISQKKIITNTHENVDIPDNADTTDDINISIDNSTENDIGANNLENNTFSSNLLLFISKLYGNSSLPRNFVQNMVNDMKEIFSKMIGYVRNKFCDHSMCKVFDEVLMEINQYFEEYRSEHCRLKFLEKSGNLILPKSYYIGPRTTLSRINTCDEPTMDIKKSEGQIIPLRKTLKKYLELPNVLSGIRCYIETESSNDDNIMTSIFQGEIWKKMRSKFKDKIVIPYFLYFDDFECCNPLGSRAGIYKIGAVYISLCGVPPEYDTLLNNIMLSQLFFSTDRNFHGNDKVFTPLINELHFLEREGIFVEIDSKEVKVYFSLLLVLGDNLGLNSILGFNESFQAEFFCRFCICTKTDTWNQITENSSKLRTIENYEVDCRTLSNGVKEKCIWNRLENFHVAQNVSCDLMHDLLEGVLRYDMCHLVNILIKKKYFSLELLNNRIKYFKFNEADIGNLFPQIKYDQLKKKQIVMSASEMLAFVTYFGILIGDLVPENEPSWQIFTLIHQIMDILLSRTISKTSLSYLTVLIEEHHTLYLSIFQDTLKPKFHFLVHYPRIISLVGPVRSIWCMKYESFHKVLKSTANVVTNRKNIIYTIALKQQLSFSHKLLTNHGFKSEIFEYSSHHVDIRLSPDFGLIASFADSHEFSLDNTVSLQRITIYNTSYRLGLALETHQDHEDELLSFGIIEGISICTINNTVIFIMAPLVTICLHPHIQAFEVKRSPRYSKFVLTYSSLLNTNPYNIHYSNDGTNFISHLQ